VTSASRSLFLLIFTFKNEALVFGKYPHLGHPCQKQPSIKTARFSLGKKKSGLPGNSFGRILQPLMDALARGHFESKFRCFAIMTSDRFHCSRSHWTHVLKCSSRQMLLKAVLHRSYSLVIEGSHCGRKPEEFVLCEITSYPIWETVSRKLQSSQSARQLTNFSINACL